jgi:hypothetical protein
MVRAGRHALRLCSAQRLCRKLHHVHPRRRLSRGERGHGRAAGEIVRLSADVRLHPHRPDQCRLGRAIPRGHGRESAAFDSTSLRAQRRCASGPGAIARDADRHWHHGLFLAHQHHRNPRVEQKGAADHAADDGDGSGRYRLVCFYSLAASRASPSAARAPRPHTGIDWLAGEFFPASSEPSEFSSPSATHCWP